ncbi:MAG: GNAT family N-acetyltransferase [Syntrophobacteraceae bacterium]|jgi:glutaconate CoA-transferase subunit A
MIQEYEKANRNYTEFEKLVFTKDGKPVYIRQLRWTDECLIKELFESLSRQSIYFRFQRYWKSVPAEIIAYFTKVDCNLNVGMVAVEKRPPDERVLGLCSILRKAGSIKGEIGVVVRDEWQGIGVGAELLLASLHPARRLGMKELWGIASPENVTMLALANKLGFTVGKYQGSDLSEMKMHFNEQTEVDSTNVPISWRSSMTVLEKGQNVLLMDPDPDKARQFFQRKSRAMTDKRMTVKEAVEKFIPDGSYLAIGGFGANRIPTSVLHEILRKRRKNLGFLGHTSTHDFQILCAGKCIDRVDASYIVGLEARGLSPNARRVMESGEVQVTEWTNYTLLARLRAAAEGVSFTIARCMLGTDTFKMSAAKTIECPFTGHKYAALPAVWPDVAAIHVHEADIYGNSHIRGISISDLELARASKRLIITTERFVRNDAIRLNPTKTVIPFYLVDAVVEVPYGSYPGNMAYEYFSDEEHLKQWLRVEKDPDEFSRFLDKYIYGVSTFEQYLELCGGLSRMQELRNLENPVDRL